MARKRGPNYRRRKKFTGNVQPAKIQIDGSEALKFLLKYLPQKTVKKALRQGINAAATPIVSSARRFARKRFGWLKKAMAKRLKTYKDGNVVAIIGASRQVVGHVGENPKKKRQPGDPAPTGARIVPAHYIHLVEKGHGGPRPAKPYPFLEPAFRLNEKRAVNIAAAKFKAVIEREAARAGKI